MSIGEKYKSVHNEFPNKHFATLTLRNYGVRGAAGVDTVDSLRRSAPPTFLLPARLPPRTGEEEKTARVRGATAE